ncbi:MAG: hypothetical protein A3A44_03010 [Candidatus Sungbacteria bacterium RIFCSPLOWO2_01_FULL_60_25]|uniref:Uncharacterized protein n=1 Tax=Candidatus Sungbacteria bacterium RIFCSPLOWO2_01_FULL_60_25 TaxID=1802281 RepID=A0A1G2L9N2_9BACT|nr:MAG: hypothetical protein A3A44_03010 [Candidatus Sungbacteria bacterium RIFCSPLOWO2_01_FULL_60_25]
MNIGNAVRVIAVALLAVFFAQGCALLAGTACGAATAAATRSTAAGVAAGAGCAALALGAQALFKSALEERRAGERAAVAAAPQEACSWVYDHTGKYSWRCAGHVGPRPASAPPQLNFPAPEKLTPDASAAQQFAPPPPPPPAIAPQAYTYAPAEPVVVYVRSYAPRYYYWGRWHHIRPARAHIINPARF